MNVNPVERRRRRRRKRRRAKEEEEEEEGFFVYRRDPWTKERVKVNEDGEEIERSCSSESSESDSEAHRPRSSSFSFSFSSTTSFILTFVYGLCLSTRRRRCANGSRRTTK